MADELERALRQRDLELLAESRNPRGVAPKKAGPLDLGVGLKERLAFLNQTLNPVEAIGQSMGAGERLLSGDVEGYDQLAALGDMLSGAASVLPGIGPLVRGSRTAVKAANTAKPSGAVIRQDDTFRGEGPITTSIAKATKPYAVRVTGQSQIDDMIQSGMVRPPEGGYAGKPVVYFHEMDEAAPKSVFHTPKSDPGKGYSIVMKSEKAAGREGPISLDDLEHIWTLRDGEMVDILDEVRAMNRDFDSLPDDVWDTVDYIPPSFPNYGPDDDIPFAKGGIVKGSYLDFDPYD